MVINLFGYVLGDPVNFVDPDGRIVLNAVGAGVGALVSVGLQLVANDGDFGAINLQEVATAAITGAVLPGSLGIINGATRAGAIAGIGVRLLTGLNPNTGPYPPWYLRDLLPREPKECQ